MQTYKQFTEDTMSPYDDWGVGSTNNNAITEAGLARIIKKVKTDEEDFIIITAYRGTHDKKENV